MSTRKGLLYWATETNHYFRKALFRTWKIKADDIVQLEEVNESNKVNVLRAIGGGALGTLLAGPIGLLAGALLGGRGKKYVVLIRDSKGRRLLCAVKQKEYEVLLAATVSRLIGKRRR